MTRIASWKLLTLLLPLALFFAVGLGAAWAVEGMETCGESVSAECCCAPTPSDVTGCDLPNNFPPVGPCGSPKSDCGCDNSLPVGDAGLRAIKPGRMTDDPDFAIVVYPCGRGAVYAALSGNTNFHHSRIEYPPEHYLQNCSLRC